MLTRLKVADTSSRETAPSTEKFWSKPNSSRNSRAGGLWRAIPCCTDMKRICLAGSLREPWITTIFWRCDKTPLPSKLRMVANESTAESGSGKEADSIVRQALPAGSGLSRNQAVLGVSEDKASL